MLERLKYRVYDILVETDDNEIVDRVVAVMLLVLVFISSAAVVLETVEEYNEQFGSIFYAVELVSVTIFTVEYLLHLWIAPLDPNYSKPITGRIKYAFSLMALVDLLAVLPFFLPFILPANLRILRFLRIFRLFRLLKMSRHIESLNTLDNVIRAKKEELTIIAAMILMLLLFSSSLIYLVESEAQPDKFPNIPAAMWWGVATLTTVGYGDIYPITPLGKILSGFIAFLGIGMFALPTGILASGFAEEVAKRRRKTEECFCPHCGGDISSVSEKK
ncbi:MAG TPA: ion transporter [Pyrinomonadaceae bacterium]|nr:ion transporter [Pyrinomonadaceae bacterium]